MKLHIHIDNTHMEGTMSQFCFIYVLVVFFYNVKKIVGVS